MRSRPLYWYWGWIISVLAILFIAVICCIRIEKYRADDLDLGAVSGERLVDGLSFVEYADEFIDIL
jgi:hypothetical protein